MDKQYDDEKKGYLWHENDAVIERKGSFVINGEKKYGAIVKSFNAQNEAKYEMMMSIGLLHLNTDKQSDKTPDMGGKVTVDGVVKKLFINKVVGQKKVKTAYLLQVLVFKK